MPHPKTPSRKRPLFKKEMKPTPPAILALRRRIEKQGREFNEHSTEIDRIIIAMQKESNPLLGGLLHHVADEKLKPLNAALEKEKELQKELRAWEKKNRKRARGYRAWVRIFHSLPAYRRLQRLQEFIRAQKELGKLALLRELDKMGKLSEWDRIKLDVYSGREDQTNRIVQQGLTPKRKRASQ